MTLLTDDEFTKLSERFWRGRTGEDDFDEIGFGRAIESAVLAKLAGMELPEPETFEVWNAKQHGDPEEIGFLQALRIAYCCGQDSVNQHQAFAQGAASQLAEKPTCWITPDGEGFRMRLSPPVNEVALGWQELYTRKESK